ncbi:MAG: AAA family ATPase [Candidatus Diapherotrites archaeon]|uniref:AAA family ATPase n=1 Tax=Candidatus Iainarchaeum sp. TaxID=3101447 RepID=A0A8T3YQF0_9ARCH|nr:AAA family ATPase [Candidatus Diapherotrites archaeon]
MPAIVIVGLARSGKDTAADYIAEKYRYKKYTFSSVLREMIEKRGEKPAKESMLALGDMLRKRMGMDAVAKYLDKKIKETDNILLVGPRSIEEINYFRKKFPSLKIIRIAAGKEDRFSRKSAMDPKGRSEFFSRDEKDSQTKGMQKALDAAQFEISNDSTKKKLHERIDALMKNLRG